MALVLNVISFILMSTTNKTMALRLPTPLYEALRTLSKQSGESMNSLIVEGVANRVKEQRRAVLYDSFTLLGQDDADVEFAFKAQTEAVDD